MPPAKSTQPAGQAPPAKKRRKLTEEEKKAQADDKAAREAERERKRKEKEAEAEKKKAESDKKKAEAEKKKAETERKKREKEEEAERKQRTQPKIGSFFAKQTLTSNLKEPRGRTDLPVGARSPSPVATERNDYQRLAQEFFVKENVTLASNKFAPSPTSQAAKVAVLDDFVAGRRAPIETKSSDPFRALNLPNGIAHPRGKIYPSVRGLLSGSDGLQTSLADLTTESQNLRIQKTQQALRRIPLKHLKFHEDVRPAYYGTVTSVESLASLRKLAKNPIAKDLPLNYDYDSEAEWVDGGDDGEGDDVSLMEEDDVDEEDGEGLDDFLDDSEDVGRGPRMTAGIMEPESSGVCFEDRTRKNPNPQMYKFRMEFMIRE
jgi:chromatin assembly factor 1 subunit A